MVERQLLRRIVEQHRDQILKLAMRYGAGNVRVFGSVAAGSATEDSDLGLLVDMEPKRSLLDRIALMQELEEMLNFPVDVVTVKSLHPSIRDGVVEQAIAL